jgi:hypothetical protein
MNEGFLRVILKEVNIIKISGRLYIIATIYAL